jgi:hypothetical protein
MMGYARGLRCERTQMAGCMIVTVACNQVAVTAAGRGFVPLIGIPSQICGMMP